MIQNNLFTEEGIKEFRAGIYCFPKEWWYSTKKALRETPKPWFITLPYALYYIILQLIINENPYSPKGSSCTNCGKRFVCHIKTKTKRGIVGCGKWEKHKGEL